MPRTKKAAVAEEVVLNAIEEETAAPDAEAAPAPAKAKKPRNAKKAAEKAPAEKKSACAAKKDGKLTAKVVVELSDRSATPEELVERAKTDWANKGNSVDEINALAVYVNVAEGTVYYVVNDDYLSGSFDF